MYWRTAEQTARVSTARLNCSPETWQCQWPTTWKWQTSQGTISSFLWHVSDGAGETVAQFQDAMRSGFRLCKELAPVALKPAIGVAAPEELERRC